MELVQDMVLAKIDIVLIRDCYSLENVIYLHTSISFHLFACANSFKKSIKNIQEGTMSRDIAAQLFSFKILII